MPNLTPLRQLRQLRNVARDVVAEAIGVSLKTIARWEEGETHPTLPDAVKLARYYNATLDQLAGLAPLPALSQRTAG